MNIWLALIFIIFLSAWLIVLTVCILLSLCFDCIDCQDGTFIIRRRGRRWRANAINASLVTKKVQDHAFLSAKCEEFLSSQMLNSITTLATARSSLSMSNISASLSNSNKMQLSQSQVTNTHDNEGPSESNDCNDDKYCSICLDEFKVGDEVSWSRNLTHCRHAYHTACIKAWLKRNADCPICRAPFFTRHDMDVRVTGCCEFLKVCCCRSEGDRENSDLVEIKYNTNQKTLFEYRDKFNFCVIHGLIRPPGYVILTSSDEEMNGVKAVKRRSRLSLSLNEDYITSPIRDLELAEVNEEDDSSGGLARFGRFNSICSGSSPSENENSETQLPTIRDETNDQTLEC